MVLQRAALQAEALELGIRKALNKVLVLPRKISSNIGPERPLAYTELERAGLARVSIKILEAQDVEDVQAMHKLDPYVVVKMLGSPADKRGIPKFGMPQIYRCRVPLVPREATRARRGRGRRGSGARGRRVSCVRVVVS